MRNLLPFCVRPFHTQPAAQRPEGASGGDSGEFAGPAGIRFPGLGRLALGLVAPW
jgi:hypothetical protein